MSKKTKSNVIGVTVTAALLLVIGVVSVLFYNAIIEKDKKDEVKVGQARENVKMAEELVAKEFDKDKKYFRLATTEPVGTYLYDNTDYPWVDGDLKAVVKFDDSEYTVRFKTKEVKSEYKDVELHEPVEISKVLKK
ncbi:hypothetical protein FT641_18175 [Bacillus paranthracis]|uniref:hypothetical protein n=1 Tax=Bacillus paranthracis TaxID=2026186 RepID=UPI00187A38C8|nr:hypothetical protein [Bacillus paranthracis]MBE7114510.1 hypothetical protein [Bacillus paranthracis]MBE7154616.1 hypothetical protein [Bacillus paranthracis]